MIDLRENFRDYIVNFSVEESHSKELLCAMDTLLESGDFCASLSSEIEAYRSFDFNFERFTEAAIKNAEACKVDARRARFIYSASLANFALPYYERVGLGYENWKDSMFGLRWEADMTYSRQGTYGIASEWFKRFFIAERIAFGRLQYNRLEAGVEYKSENFDLKPDTPVITVHIPTDKRMPFSPENRLASYKSASKFYSKYFDGGRVIFRCGTWLLNPLHKEILPESSNIRSFVDDFELVPSSYKKGQGDFWRIFGNISSDTAPENLPEENSLQRAYKKHLMAGGEIGWICGFRLGDMDA